MHRKQKLPEHKCEKIFDPGWDILVLDSRELNG
jgi:hypothetical protein